MPRRPTRAVRRKEDRFLAPYEDVLTQSRHLLLRRLAALQQHGDEQLSEHGWFDLTRAVSTLPHAAHSLQQMRHQASDHRAIEAARNKPPPKPNDGSHGASVVRAVREALGMPLDDEEASWRVGRQPRPLATDHQGLTPTNAPTSNQ